MIDIRIRASGPLFDGRARRATADLVEACVTTTATEAKDRLVGSMASTFRDPTPYYWTQVRVDQVSRTRAVVDDARSGSRMVYGPWLEGVGSRNRVVRFKGYRIWRTIRRVMAVRKREICRAVAPTYLRRMR